MSKLTFEERFQLYNDLQEPNANRTRLMIKYDVTRAYLSVLAVSPPTRFVPKRERVEELLRQGVSKVNIAVRCEVSKNYVAQVRSALGLCDPNLTGGGPRHHGIGDIRKRDLSNSELEINSRWRPDPSRCVSRPVEPLPGSTITPPSLARLMAGR